MLSPRFVLHKEPFITLPDGLQSVRKDGFTGYLLHSDAATQKHITAKPELTLWFFTPFRAKIYLQIPQEIFNINLCTFQSAF
jgi:hypothetical protein